MKHASFPHSSREVAFTLDYFLLLKNFEKATSLFKKLEDSFSSDGASEKSLFLSLLKFATENDCFSLILWMRSNPVYLRYLNENEGKVYSIFIKRIKFNLEILKNYLPTLKESERRVFFNFLPSFFYVSGRDPY